MGNIYQKVCKKKKKTEVEPKIVKTTPIMNKVEENRRDIGNNDNIK